MESKMRSQLCMKFLSLIIIVSSNNFFFCDLGLCINYPNFRDEQQVLRDKFNAI
jgi:hypothetical protein